MKKIKLFTGIIVLFCSFIFMGFDSEQDKVYDDAGLFTESEKRALQERCVSVATDTKIDIIIVTTADNQGKTATEYAEDFFMAHSFGYDELHGDGILLLLDMDGREVGIATSGKAIDNISDSRIDDMLTEVISELSAGNYADAGNAFLDEMDALLGTKTIGEKLTKYLLIFLGISAAIAGVTVVIMLSGAKAKMTVGSRTYVNQGVQIRNQKDHFLHTTVVKHKIERNTGGGSGGSGGSFHTGSGGHKFGGGSRKF
jgi:uncharacterized protein